MNNNFILLLVGKSGSGKSFIANRLGDLYDWKSIQSYTTRKKRYNDEDGHIFVTNKDVPSQDKMVAYTEFNGNKYWATQQQVEENQIYIIDPKGVKTFLQRYKGNKKVIVCYVQCSIQSRFKRMKQRITENYSYNNRFNYEQCEKEALERIENDGFEFSNNKTNRVDMIIDNSNDNISNLLYNLRFIKEKVEEKTKEK